MLNKYFKEYVLKNKYDLFIIITMFVIGICAGICVFVFANEEAKTMLISEAKSVFELSASKEYLETNVVSNGIKTNIILICILVVASTTLFGRYIILMLTLIKGMMTSIYALLLFNVFGIGYGILSVLLLVILVNVIYIPAYVYLAIMFLEIHFNIFKAKRNVFSLKELLNYMVKTLVTFVIIFSSVITEQVASLAVLRLFSKIN